MEVFSTEDQIVMADALPGRMEQPPVGCRGFQKITEARLGAEAEHRALAMLGDQREFLHDVFHPRFACRSKKHAKIVDAEMFVDDAGGDDLAISEDFRHDHSLDAFGGLVGFEGVIAAADREQGIWFDEGLAPIHLYWNL